ncbi:MAG: hypothetical protein WD077_07585 [Bacteroidia bacterium]
MLLILVPVLFQGCETINPAEEIPSYIRIDSVSLETTTGQGSNSHNITDAWMIAQGKSVGVFELPALFPVLPAGPKEIVVQPGIKENGIANTRVIYPFYQPYQVTLNLDPTDVDTIKPVFKYTSTTQFGFIENFDGVALNFNATNNSQYPLARTGDPAHVFEGDSSLRITFDAGEQLFEMMTTELFNLPRGRPIFLEMDFKCEAYVTVGIFAESQAQAIQQPLVVLNLTDVWKKIYIEAGSLISGYNDFYSFRIFIGAQSTAGGQSITLDNIKLLYLE